MVWPVAHTRTIPGDVPLGEWEWGEVGREKERQRDGRMEEGRGEGPLWALTYVWYTHRYIIKI